MRKIYSFMVAAVALFAAVSCNKELPQEENLPMGETVVYTASVDGTETKAALNADGNKSEWVAGDAITVLDGNDSYEFTTAIAGANGEFSNSEGFGDYRPVMAVYPAGEYSDVSLTDKKVKAYIPTWQQAQVGTYHSPAALAVAYSENSSFAFKNAHALLKFTVNTDNVTHVIFHGNTSEAITGDVYVTLGAEGVSNVECLETVFTEQQWDETTQQNKEVQVTKYGTWVECYAYHDDSNKYFAKGQTYYIAVAPQKFEGGVTVKVKINDGEELVAKTTTNKVETKINTILNLGEIKYEAPVVHEWAVAGTFNEWSTTANPMELVDGYYVAKNVTGLNYSDPNEGETGSSTGIKLVNKGETWRGGEGQVTTGTWAYVWGDGGNIYVDGATAETAYDIYLNPSEGDYGKFVIVTAGAVMPEDVVVEEEVVVDYWAVIGSMTSNWNSDIKMILDGEWYVAENVKILDSDQFKFRANGNWDEGTPNRGAAGEADGVLIENNVETAVYQGGKNFCVSEGGFYSLYINKSATKVKVVKTAELPVESVPDQPSDWALWAQSPDWKQIDMVTTTVPDLYVAKGVELEAYKSFLVKPAADWSTKYGCGSVNYIQSNKYIKASQNGGDITVEAAGTYDIYFDNINKYVYLMTSGVAYSSATQQTTSGVEPEPEPEPETGVTIYLKPGVWETGGARYQAWIWGAGDKWVAFTKVSDGLYSTKVPEGTTGMKVLRKGPDHANNAWQSWNDTGDVTLGGKNCIEITGWNQSYKMSTY